MREGRMTKKQLARRERILTGRRPTRKSMMKKGCAGGAKPRYSGMDTSMIVPMFLHMLNTVKLYHWRTTSYSTHKATDELYKSLNESLDKFVEVMLGKREMGGRAKLLNVSMIKLSVYSNNEAFTKQIESYKAFLMDFSDASAFDPVMNADLLAIRDEILADFNQFLYLLSLED